MADKRLRKLADVLVNYSTRVEPGEWVHINAGRVAVPLVREVIAYVLAAGGRPTVSLGATDLEEVYLDCGSDEQLSWVSPLEMLVIKEVDVSIFIEAPENTRALSNIDPERQQKRQAAYKEWVEIYSRRSAAGDMRWVMTNYPCLALAQESDMSLADYEDFIFAATFVDQDDPVSRWQRVHDDQERLVAWLAGKKEVVIQGPNVDLKMSIEGRKFINSYGDQNMPSGEIFTSPVEDSANGWVKFTYPAVEYGREVEGIHLQFENGMIVKASADKNEGFLHKMLKTDEGAGRLGELGIGTNYGIQRFTRNILFDEKIGGTFHLAVGNGFPEAGGANESSLHWDMICDAREDTQITVDGEVFYKDGDFRI